MLHVQDPVPQVPLEKMGQTGFWHIPYEVFYELDYNKWRLCSISGEDESCQDKYKLDLDVNDHLHYLDMDFITNWLSCPLN